MKIEWLSISTNDECATVPDVNAFTGCREEGDSCGIEVDYLPYREGEVKVR